MSVPAGPCLLPGRQGPHGAWNSPGPPCVSSSQDIRCHRAEGFTATKVSSVKYVKWKKNPYPKGINFSRQNSAIVIRDSKGDIHPTPNSHTHKRGFSPPSESYHIGRATPFTPQEPGGRGTNPVPWRDQSVGPHETRSSRSELFIHTSQKRSSTWQEARVFSNAEKTKLLALDIGI